MNGKQTLDERDVLTAMRHIQQVHDGMYPRTTQESTLKALRRLIGVYRTDYYKEACRRLILQIEQSHRSEDTSAKWLELLTGEQK